MNKKAQATEVALSPAYYKEHKTQGQGSFYIDHVVMSGAWVVRDLRVLVVMVVVP